MNCNIRNPLIGRKVGLMPEAVNDDLSALKLPFWVTGLTSSSCDREVNEYSLPLDGLLITDLLFLLLKMVIPHLNWVNDCSVCLWEPLMVYICSEVDIPFEMKYHVSVTQRCVAWKVKVNEMPVCEDLKLYVNFFFGSSKLSWLRLWVGSSAFCRLQLLWLYHTSWSVHHCSLITHFTTCVFSSFAFRIFWWEYQPSFVWLRWK